MLRKIVFYTLMLYTGLLNGQVFPPDPLCISGDTIFWDLPINGCGSFNSYDVFVATDPAGPFSLLANVPDPFQDFFVDPNPSDNTFYYYLESNYDCPGEIVLPSDTISNLPLAVSPITSLNVNGSAVELEWQASSSPEVYAYIVYRLINGNVDPLDTIYTGTTYVDLLANPNTKSEQYYVLALDPCGNTSIFLDPQSTIFLELSSDPCSRSIDLEWNPYTNWVNGPDRQELWVSKDGGAYELTETLDPSTANFGFTDLEDNSNYCFYVAGIEAITGRVSGSNVVCADADIVQPPDDLILLNVTYINGGTEINWLWNVDAELAGLQFETHRLSDGGTSIFGWTDFMDPLSFANATFLNTSATSGPIEYQLVANDLCGDQWPSKIIRTVFLEGSSPFPGEYEINWTPFLLEGATVLEYEIYRILNDATEFLGTVSGSDRSYVDFISPADIGNDAVYYYVEARFAQILPSGEEVIANSRSNEVCLRPKPRMYIPNVFAPTGVENRVFRPFIEFVEPGEDYLFQIYNRWGALIFQTADITEAWDGSYNGQIQPAGVYVYRLRLETPSFGLVEQKGSVTLIR